MGDLSQYVFSQNASIHLCPHKLIYISVASDFDIADLGIEFEFIGGEGSEGFSLEEVVEFDDVVWLGVFLIGSDPIEDKETQVICLVS